MELSLRKTFFIERMRDATENEKITNGKVLQTETFSNLRNDTDIGRREERDSREERPKKFNSVCLL